MTDFSLDSIVIKPDNDDLIKKAIILFHGYGGDGKDISTLSYNWKRYLKNTVIICPNGLERCKANPNGYEWFDLSIDDESYIVTQSINAEEKINLFINEVKKEFKLENKHICSSGFSQGCMLVLNIGLSVEKKYNSLIGFSGKIINKDYLSKKIIPGTKVLLLHGDLDVIVPPNNLLEAKDFLLRNKINVKTKLLRNCQHNIPIEASSIALKFITENLYKDLI